MMLSEENSSTRERSLRAALEVVREEGLDHLTTRSIARRSGLTQPAIYRHFSGVDELIRDTLALIRDRFIARMDAGEGTGDATAELRRVLDVFREFAVEEPRLFDALFFQVGEEALTPAPGDASKGQNIFGRIVERVRACADEGVIRSGGVVASALSLVAHAQGMILMYRQGRFASSERFAEAYSRSLDDLIRGLAREETGA